MVPAIAIALAGVLAGAGDASLVDRIALLRVGKGQQTKPLSVFSHGINGGSDDCTGSLAASDPKVAAFAKKQAGRFLFAADWDGDGEDELIVVREKKKDDHPLDLRVFRFPETVNADVGKALASSPAFGNAKGDDRVVAIGAADVDGDPADEIDELLVLTESAAGVQSLAVHALPATKKQPLGAPLHLDADVAHADTFGVVSICGIDLDGQPGDEIAMLLRSPSGGAMIAFHSPSALATGDLGPPLADFADVSEIAMGGFEVDSISRVRLLNTDRLLLLLIDASGDRRIEIHDPPAAIGATVATPLASDSSLGFGSSSFVLVGAVGHRKWFDPPPPDATFEIAIPLYVVIARTFSFGVTTDQTVTVRFDGNNFTFEFPANPPIVVGKPPTWDESGWNTVDLEPNVFLTFPATLNFQDGPLLKDVTLQFDMVQIFTIPGTETVTGFTVLGGGVASDPGGGSNATIKYVNLFFPEQ